jgi:hypothetical protein
MSFSGKREIQNFSITNVATSFFVDILSIKLFNQATLRVMLYDKNENLIKTDILYLEDNDYLNWTGDDNYVINYVAKYYGFNLQKTSTRDEKNVISMSQVTDVNEDETFNSTSNVSESTNNVEETSNVSDSALESSNNVEETSNVLDTTNNVEETSNVSDSALESSNNVEETSNVLDTTNNVEETSNVLDTTNNVEETSNVSDSASESTNNVEETSNVSDSASESTNNVENVDETLVSVNDQQ